MCGDGQGGIKRRPEAFGRKSTYFRGGDEESASARGKVGGSQSEGGSFHVNSSKSQSNLVGHGRGVGGDVGGRDRLSLGFLNCRGWWSREVDIRLMLRKKGLDVLGLAETFLQLDQEGKVGGGGGGGGGYVWYGMNRVGVKKASGGVGLLVHYPDQYVH